MEYIKTNEKYILKAGIEFCHINLYTTLNIHKIWATVQF